MKRPGHRTHMSGRGKRRVNRFTVEILKRQAKEWNRRYAARQRDKD
jgi:hypothetical protein